MTLFMLHCWVERNYQCHFKPKILHLEKCNQMRWLEIRNMMCCPGPARTCFSGKSFGWKIHTYVHLSAHLSIDPFIQVHFQITLSFPKYMNFDTFKGPSHQSIKLFYCEQFFQVFWNCTVHFNNFFSLICASWWFKESQLLILSIIGV